ncbi:lysophospholipid acyltransferase family protein [Marinicella meishanensis]|uniref:lysophospholipid acyltransferase family protein n=1 Tax=Marinicella meishanensis TaxID=2873263 RepID=UPI001CBC71C4|nr:GNAT family N-acyltransferase [Marinicella sp. NBU2979]
MLEFFRVIPMIDIQQSLLQHYPELAPKVMKFEKVFKLLERVLHTDEINQFIQNNRHLTGFAFLDAILKEFDFGYKVSNKNLIKIPAEGRVVIVANHPIGSLDGLALMRMIYDIRPDVKIVATPLLSSIEPIKELFLPIDNISQKAQHKQNIANINQALQQEQAVIIFPAGEVSRITPKGVKDGPWKSGFVRLANKNQAPIMPVFIDSRNSAIFYAASMVYKPLSSLLLINEMFKQKSNTIEFHIGDPVAPNDWQGLGLKPKALARKFRKHLFGLRKQKSQFNTTPTIAHPIRTRRLWHEVKQLQPLGSTQDGMRIFLMPYQPDSLLMQEIGRLRELSFRMVKEGTGQRRDLDAYDVHYRHLLLWNDQEMELVGAYRLGFCGEIISQRGMAGIYSSTLYDFDHSLVEIADQCLELGRSFVQPKYWGLRGLEYLWYGIGAVLNQHPEIKYLFGAVSIPGNYPTPILAQMAAHYSHHFPKPASAPSAQPHHPFDMAVSAPNLELKPATKQLMVAMKAAGVKLPVLFKQYTDLCEPGGVGFINFAVDPDFSGCVDGLIWLELAQMKANKRAKYIEHHAAPMMDQSA